MEGFSPVAAFAASYVGFHAIWSCSYTLLSTAHKRIDSGDRQPWVRALIPFVEDDFTRRRTGNYVLSFLHASIQGVRALRFVWAHGVIQAETKQLWSDPVAAASGTLPACAPLPDAQVMLAFSIAYFLHDLLSTMPDWGRNYADVAHHFAGLVLTASPFLSIPATVLGHIILVTEISTCVQP